MRTPLWPNPTSLRNISCLSPAKGTREFKGLSLNLMVKMSHVAAQKIPCCQTRWLSDSLRICYSDVEMARTVGAASTKRGVPFWAHFFFLLEARGPLRPLIARLFCRFVL